MKEGKKEGDAITKVFADINKRISQLETDIKRLEDVSLKLIENQKDLIAIVKEIGTKVLLIDKNKNGKRNDQELDTLYR